MLTITIDEKHHLLVNLIQLASFYRSEAEDWRNDASSSKDDIFYHLENIYNISRVMGDLILNIQLKNIDLILNVLSLFGEAAEHLKLPFDIDLDKLREKLINVDFSDNV